MGFLRFSSVLLFLLSFVSAVASVYLSTIRENEKEKRIQLEEVRDQLETQVGTLKTENSQLAEELSRLRFRNEELEQKYAEAEEARTQALNLIREKDMDLDALREEVTGAKKAFDTAQKRNEELERVLQELELRMSRMGRGEQLENQAATYVGMDVGPEGMAPRGETKSENSLSISGEPAALTKDEFEAVLPKEKKKRRSLFSFLRRSKKAEASTEGNPSEVSGAVPALTATSESEAQTQTIEAEHDVAGMKTDEEEPVASQPLKAAPKEEEDLPFSAAPPMPNTDQAIAAGRVLLINRKFNFLVTNLGSRQGLNVDDVLVVEKDGSQIAKARVEKLYDDYCAAYIVEEQVDIPVEEGFLVTAV